MAGHKVVKIAQQKTMQVRAAEKPKPPPEKARKTTSVASLFQQKHEPKRKAEGQQRDLLAPRSAGVSKPYGASRRSRGYENPVFRKFQGVTNAYREASGYGTEEQLEPVYNELVAQVDDLAVGDGALPPKDATSGAENEGLAAEHARLASALSEDKIQIQRIRADGSTVNEERKLSDTMKTFERVLDQKRNDLDQLLRELTSVDSEIASVKEDIVAVEQKEVKQLKRSFDAQVAALVKQAEAGSEALRADVQKARKEDKKNTALQQQRFEQFMETI